MKENNNQIISRAFSKNVGQLINEIKAELPYISLLDEINIEHVIDNKRKMIVEFIKKHAVDISTLRCLKSEEIIFNKRRTITMSQIDAITVGKAETVVGIIINYKIGFDEDTLEVAHNIKIEELKK